MGLDTSHGCWHGAYSAFMRWRNEIARAAGLPPLKLMEGFYEPGSYDDPFVDYAKSYPNIAKQYTDSLPIKWDCLKPSALHILLNHSDCEGEIDWNNCDLIADELERLLPNLPIGEGGGHIGNWLDKTSQFIKGLRLAASRHENVDFH